MPALASLRLCASARIKGVPASREIEERVSGLGEAAVAAEGDEPGGGDRGERRGMQAERLEAGTRGDIVPLHQIGRFWPALLILAGVLLITRFQKGKSV